MSHKALRELIQDTVTSLADNITFSYGRTSDFDQQPNKPIGVLVNLDLMSSSPEFAVDGVTNYTKAWGCSMAFYKFDSTASTELEYTPILDDTDLLVDQFINKLNKYSYDADTIMISGIAQEPFVKVTKDILTGHLLRFTVQVQDTFDYCAIDCERSNPNDC